MMEGDEIYSIVVSSNGITLSLLAGALVSSSTPSSNTVPRITCAENQTFLQVPVVGTRHENKSSTSPVSRPSPERSRILAPSGGTYRRARSKARSKSRSRSKSRCRSKKTSCSPISRKSRPESKSPKRERRSCSVTSTCSKYCGSSSPNRRLPPSRPLSKDRCRKDIELRRTALGSPNRTASRNHGIATTTKTPELSVRIESEELKAKRLIKSTTEPAISLREKPKSVARDKEDNKTLNEDKHTEIERERLNINVETQALDKKMRCDNGKEECGVDFKESGSKKHLPGDAVVNYMTGWLNCVEKIKSFYSDPVDCTGFDACPLLRERMAQHRLRHHTGRGFVPHVSTKRYAFEESEPQWTDDWQRSGRSERPTREMVDEPVQTKLTLGDLGEIVIKLDKSIKVSKENNKYLKKRRRSTLRGDNYAIDKGPRNIDIDYKKHRICRLDSDHTMQYGNKQNEQNSYDIDKTVIPNEERKMSQIRNSYSRSRQNSSSKSRSPNNDQSSYNRYNEDKNIQKEKRRQTFDNISGNQNIRNQDGLNMNSNRKNSTKPNGNNEYHSKNRTNLVNDDITNQDKQYENSERKYSVNPNNYNQYGPKVRKNTEQDLRRSQTQDGLNINNNRKNSTKPDDNNEYNSYYSPNPENDNMINQDKQYKNSERKYSVKPSNYNQYGPKVRKNTEQDLRKSQTNNNYINKTSYDDENKIPNNNYAFSERNPDTATSSKLQTNNIDVDLRRSSKKFDDNINEPDKDIPLVNNPTYNLITSYSDKNELNEAVQDWLKNVPLFPNISEKDTIINELLEKINDLSHAPIEREECDNVLEVLISEYLEKLYAWYPGDKQDQDDYKRNLIKSFVHRIKPILKENSNDGNDLLGPVVDQMDDSVGSANGKRSRRSSRSKKKSKRERGDHLIRCTISSNVICGDARVKKMKPSEKYKPEFAQEICNWLARYNFLQQDGVQQISTNDLVGILLNRLSPYLDRPYNSTNKLILKAKIVDIINSLPICLHHSPHQKTQVIKFADELTNMLLNIQTRFDDDSSKYHRPVTRKSELRYIANAVETCKKYYLRNQISEQLRQCLQETMLTNHLIIQNQLTEVVLNYFELFQSGQKDVTKNAVLKALEKANVIEEEKISIANSIIGSLEALSAKETIEDMIETKLTSRYSISRIPMGLSEMEVCDTVFAVSTKRYKKEPGLSPLEYEYFNMAIDVISEWSETLPPPFPKLSKKQKEQFIYELSRDMLIQKRIEKSNPISDEERQKFWMFFTYRWFYRFNLFKDLNEAEPYGSALCNKMNETIQLRMVAQTDSSEKANETETESSSSQKSKAQEKAEERDKRKREKEEEKKTKLKEREEMKQRKMKEKEEIKLKRSQEKEEAKQKRLQEKEEKKHTKLRERELRKGKRLNKNMSSDESENPLSSEEEETTQESAPEEKCTMNCKKLNTIQLDDELPIAPTPKDNHNWKCETLSFRCLQKNQDPKPVTPVYSPSPPHLEKTGSPNTVPIAVIPSHFPEVSIHNPKHIPMHLSCPPETVSTPQSQLKPNWKEKHILAQHCPCPRHNKHSYRRRSKDHNEQTQSCQKYVKYDDNTKLVQTSILHIMPQIQDKNCRNDKAVDENILISKAQERYNQIYLVKDLQNFLHSDRYSLSNSLLNSNELITVQNNNMMLDHDAVMKEFIKKYLEYSSSMDNPLIRATFFHVLKIELQKTKAYYKPIKFTRQGSSLETLAEELKYIKLISDWLKEIPVKKSFHTTMNKDRIYFVKNLAKDIVQIQLENVKAPYVMNQCLERVIKRYLIQLPLLRAEQSKVLAMTDPLIDEINKLRTSCSNHESLNGINDTEQNIIEFLDKHIRRNEKQLNYDELVLDVWAHILVREVLMTIKNRNETQVFNFSVESNITHVAAMRFRLELDYAKEIVELFNVLPILDTSIETKVKKIHELAERLLFRDIKITKNPNDDHADRELVEFMEQWMVDLTNGVVQNVEHKINRLNEDCTKTEHCTNDTFGTKLFSESTIMHYDVSDEKSSLTPVHVISHIINKWSQCLPIEGHDKETIKQIISKLLYQKTCDLQANTRICNDDFMYKCHLEAEIIAQLDKIKKNAMLRGDINYVKEILINKLMAIKNNTSVRKIGDTYRKGLEAALEDAMQTKLGHWDPSFEMYKHQLTNMYLLENFDFSKDPEKLRYKQKIQLNINTHVKNILQKCDNAMSSEEINNLMYNALSQVPAPDENYLKCEVECIKTRCEVDDWFDILPLKRTSNSSELDKWDKTLTSLTKAVYDIEQGLGNNDTLHKEILRYLAKFPLESEYELRRPELAYRLQALLASTLEARKCVTLEDQLPKSSRHQKHSISVNDHKFLTQVNSPDKEFDRKRYCTQYMNWQRFDLRNQPVIQNYGGAQFPLQQVSSTGRHVLRINRIENNFRAQNDQIIKRQAENLTRYSGDQQAMKQSSLGRCSCSISEFENCCGRPRTMISEETSTRGLGTTISRPDEPQVSGIQQMTRDGRIAEPPKSRKDNDVLDNQQDQVLSKQTTSSQTIAVQIAERGCVAQQLPQEAVTDEQREKIPNSPPQLQVSALNPGPSPAPHVTEGFGAAKTISHYKAASRNTFTHLHDNLKPSSLDHSSPTSHPQQQRTVDIPLSNKPSFCKAILPPSELTPEEVSTQQSLLSQQIRQINYSLSKSQISPKSNSESPRSESSKQNQLKLIVEKCCSQNEPHQFRVLSIPEPERTRHGSSRPSYAFLGLTRRLMIGIPKYTRSLSPNHYQLFSPITLQSDLQKQYLYTIKHGRSFYMKKEDKKHNKSASGLKYYSEPQNFNAGSPQTQIYQPVATSTDTIDCCNAEISTCDDDRIFGNDFRVQYVQEHRNRGQKPYTQFSACSSFNQPRRSHYGPYPHLDICSLHEEDYRPCKKCYHMKCKRYRECSHIPVLQYCDSVEDFLPTWLPQKWFGLAHRKK